MNSSGWRVVLSKLLPLKSSRVYIEPDALTSQNAIDVLPDPICILNRQGRVVLTNASFDSLIEARPLDYLHAHLTGDSKVPLEEALSAIINENALSQRVNIAFLVSSVRHGAEISTFDWQVRRNEKNNVIMLLGRFNKVNEEVSLRLRQKEYDLEKEKLVQSQITLETKRQFIRCVCHEVRTPLSIILNGIYVLEAECKPLNQPSLIDAIEDVKLSCQSANDLMKALLAYEQLESRTMKISPRPVDLFSCILENIETFQPAARQWNVTLTFESTVSDSVFVNASVDEFSFAVRALVDNALKFSPTGTGVRIRLYFPSETGEDDNEEVYQWIRFEVTDMGQGLTPERVATLFKNIERFTPTSNNTEQGGGVAVCVVHGIIDLHKGRVGVASPGLGQGSSYFIDMPVLRAEKGHSSKSTHKTIYQGTYDFPSPSASAPRGFKLVRNLMRMGLFFNSESSSRGMSIRNVRMSSFRMMSRRASLLANVISSRRIEASSSGADKLVESPSQVLLKGIPHKPEIVLENPHNSTQDSAPSGVDGVINEEDAPARGLSKLLGIDSGTDDTPSFQHGLLRLLLVDDVASCRKMLSKLLKNEECICDEAKDGLDAIEKVKLAMAEGIHYDGIFMDASMPNMTGSDATKAIRALGYGGKIYGVTGNSLPEDVDEFLEKGADEVKIKPLRMTDVAYLIGELKTENQRRMSIGALESGKQLHESCHDS